ncbi:uncharacterized protein LOC133203545 [Saccostrea echinata]|uniref:uncharacterized protein LOC133203545 n=1 Tax=Saccostrea echinata TaxID=191078 RepID=UPI002A808405|nr:uncharacterized protein LOC133203545 [Saccostrea echinata]
MQESKIPKRFTTVAQSYCKIRIIFFIPECICKYCYTTSTGAYTCQNSYGGQETGQIAGIAIGATVALALLIGVLVCCITKCNKKKKSRSQATRVQVNEANRHNQMPMNSIPMYPALPRAPLPEYAPPSYDSHNFNQPPPTVSATVTGPGLHSNGIGVHGNDDLPPAY